ncbi:MAG: iron-sulfur cluster assembly accessory protein [Alphaproteobacteria bacterium]|nr:iron-sulfur cluster assembly accessory protein [Alphaproteobacteria bacterium]
MTALQFNISESAKARINKILVGEPEGSRLRVSVKGGGCSGFQYMLDFDTQLNDDDMQFGTVVVDTTSLELLKESTLDYVESLGSAAFEIKNPNATAKCGCGNSFSV